MSDGPQAGLAQHSARRRRNILLLFLTVVTLGILGFVFIRHLIDFPVYYAAGRSLLSGRTDLYSPDFAAGRVMDYRYPPFFLVTLVPLWLLPYSVAAYIWYLIEILEIIGCILILRRVIGSERLTWNVWLITALAVGQYYVMVLHYGNAHVMVVFLLFVAFYFAFRERSLLAALAMAFAITIKLTPLLLLPYFALKAKRKFLLLTGALLVVINLAPAAYFGFKQNSDLLKSWYGNVVAGQEFHEVNGPINLSLKGQLRRYSTRVDYSQRVDGDVQYPAINVASQSSEQTDVAWMIISAVVFASALLLVWKGGRAGDGESAVGASSESGRAGGRSLVPDQAALEFGLMICVGLLIGPLTSKIYFIALLWPVACLASVSMSQATAVARFAYRSVLVVAAINCALPLLPGRLVQRLLLVLGVDFYVNCLLSALTVVLIASLRSRQKRSAEPQMQAPSAARTP